MTSNYNRVEEIEVIIIKTLKVVVAVAIGTVLKIETISS